MNMIIWVFSGLIALFSALALFIAWYRIRYEGHERKRRWQAFWSFEWLKRRFRKGTPRPIEAAPTICLNGAEVKARSKPQVSPARWGIELPMRKPPLPDVQVSDPGFQLKT